MTTLTRLSMYSTYYGVNAQADALWTAALNEARASRGTEAWAMSSHDMSEISTDHPTLSRSQSACNNSLPVGGLAPLSWMRRMFPAKELV